MKSLSIIMPALNEEKNIIAAIDNVLEKFKEFKIDGEIILINDGSTDNTANLMYSYNASFPKIIKVITHDLPKGVGASFWDGVKVSRKDVIVMLPGDGENDAGEIIKYIPLADHVDIINPFVVNKHVRSFVRNVFSWAFLKIINITFCLNLKYTNGTVMYRREVLERIKHKETGFFVQVEALIKGIKLGYLYAEVPYLLRKRQGGSSKAVTFKSLLNIVNGYFRLISSVYFAKNK